jgi:hypothetical protein
MLKLLISYLFSFTIIMVSCKTDISNNDQIIVCAFQKIMADHEFQSFMKDGKNYLAYLPDGYVAPDSIESIDGKISWNTLDKVKIEKSVIKKLNSLFPSNAPLKWVSSDEGEKLIRENTSEQRCYWFFGGVRKYKNQYFLECGYAISSKSGIGAKLVIEIDDNVCNIFSYHPAIM